ncbi:MAG: flagellar biosynthesis protein FlhF [Spirochaetales bacterium]|nr:flagellar biosynthesis protein FlhF [Spirochaetales bacterium]
MHQFFTESGATFQEAMDKVRNKYGGSAQITAHRTVEMGGFLGFFQREGVEISGFLKHDWNTQEKEKAKLEEEKRKLLAVAQAKVVEEKKEDHLKSVLEEVKLLKKQVEELPDKMPEARAPEHPSLKRLTEILEDNDFSPAYIRMLIDRVKRECSMADLETYETLEAKVVEWIAQSLTIYEDIPGSKPRIFILVGPTGVGKTTTIAKLAAVYGLGVGGEKPLKLSLITIDNYRIGAKQQIESYGEIMEIPVTCVESYDTLRQRIELDAQRDMILIDTIGKSPKDFVKLAEMRHLLEGCGRPSEVHLAVSATTKTKDIREIFQQFESFGYRSLVLTKLDETSVVGNLISLSWERQKPISFYTDGQAVPMNIQRATKAFLLERLVGFRPENLKLMKRTENGRSS